MDEVEERDTVNLSGDLEDLNISAINSRKLAVRALLGIHAVCEVPVEEEIVSGVEMIRIFSRKAGRCSFWH